MFAPVKRQVSTQDERHHDNRPLQPNKLSCASVSIAVGQMEDFFRLLAPGAGSTRWIPSVTGIGTGAEDIGSSSTGLISSELSSTTAWGSTRSRSRSNSRQM